MMKRNLITTIIKNNYIIAIGAIVGAIYFATDIVFLDQKILAMDVHHQFMRWLAFTTIVVFSIIINYIVSRSQQLEQKVAASQQELEQIFQSAADGMRIIGTDSTVLRVNKKFLQMTGFTEQGIIGRKCHQVFTNSKCFTQECPLTAILKQKEKAHEIETDMTRKDGGIIHCIITSTPLLDPDGKVTAVVEVIKDVTERKKLYESLAKNEERLRELFNNTTNMIQSVGPDGRILFVNKAWQKTLGYDEHDISTLNMFDIIAPESKDHCMTLFQEVTGGTVIDGIQATFIAKDGRRVFVEGNASCKLVDGNPLYTRSIFQDITDRKYAEEAKENLIQELQQALDEIDTLTGIIPICAYCKKVRDDSGYWNKVEKYISSRSKASFSHCICPSCLKTQDPEAAKELLPS